MTHPSFPSLYIHAGPTPDAPLRCELRRAEGPALVQELPQDSELVLPFETGGLATLVLPRVLESLDTATTLRLLLEGRRLLREGGLLVLDLPDFDATLAGWRRGDAQVLRRVGGVLETDVATWHARGVPDTLDYRAAALFCSFRAEGPPAYRGPPAVGLPELRWRRDRWSPFRLATDLRHALIESESRFQLERRNAWGREELETLLCRAGFRVRRFESDTLGHLECQAEPVRPAARAGCSAAEALREWQRAVDERPELAGRHYRLLWHLFGKTLREAEAARGGAAPDGTFARRGYRVGRLPEEAVAALVRVLERAAPMRLAMDDYAPGYAFNEALSPEGVVGINQHNTFLRLEAEQRAGVRPLLEALSGPVGACLGTPFRVVNLRCWKTLAGAVREETNGWHTDELFPPEVLKVMVYLTPAGAETGTTELVLDEGERVMAEGPPGTYLLFKNLERTHRGVPPRVGTRLVLELTVAPWPENEGRLVCAGLNAEFPLIPWAPVEEAS